MGPYKFVYTVFVLGVLALGWSNTKFTSQKALPKLHSPAQLSGPADGQATQRPFGKKSFSAARTSSLQEIYALLNNDSDKRGPTGQHPLVHPRVDSAIRSAASAHGLDPDLVRAVVSVESGFNSAAVSPKGAAGLMQLMPDTARETGVNNVFDERQNVAGGSRYLALLLGRFNGDHVLALAAYNAGPEAVRAHRGIPPYPETRMYVNKVMAKYRFFKESTDWAAF